MSAANWPTDFSCSLANRCEPLIGQVLSAAHFIKQKQLLIGQVMSAAHFVKQNQLLIGQLMSPSHWPTDVCCSLDNWHHLLIGQMMSAAHWPTDISCSLANWCQLLMGQVISAALLPTDISCRLANWCLLLIGQVMPAANWPSDVSWSFTNWHQGSRIWYIGPSRFLILLLSIYWSITYLCSYLMMKREIKPHNLLQSSCFGKEAKTRLWGHKEFHLWDW